MNMEDMATLQLYIGRLVVPLTVADDAIVIALLSTGQCLILLYAFRVKAWHALKLSSETTADMATS